MAVQPTSSFVPAATSLGVFGTLVLACFIAFTTTVHALEISPGTQGNVSFISGGVGQEELCQIKSMRSGYNLHLLFAEAPSSQFLADIPVRIVDQTGTAVLETRAQGPYLYARLVPGSYKILAENGDRTQIRQVRIPSYAKPVAVTFMWTSTEPRTPRIRVESLPHC